MAQSSGEAVGTGVLAPVPAAEAWQTAALLASQQVETLRHSTSLAPAAAVRGHSGAGTRLLPTRGASSPPPLQPRLPPPLPPPLHVLRSSQADAVRLDAELGGMLQEQMVKIFEYFPPGRVAELEPERSALLSLLVFALSIWPGRATPGSELLNLRYRNERAVAADPKLVGPSGVGGPGLSRTQRVALGLGSVVLPYAWARLGRKAHADDWGDAEEGSWRHRAWRAMRWCEGALAAAALLNSWVFLVRGDYRSLLERLVGARLVWRQAAMTRIISFEYLNRQLLWQQTAEALLVLLPMVDMARLRRAAMRLLPRPPRPLEQLPGPLPHEPQPGLQQGKGGPLHSDQDQDPAPGQPHASQLPAQAGPCPICGTSEMLTAVVALPCRHTFCYYCLRSNTAADPWFTCPRDDIRVAAMRRLRSS